MAKATDDDRQIRPFAAVLQEHAKGTPHARLSEALADLTAAVAATGKKGTITLTVTVAPVSKGAQNALTLSTKIAAKIPEGDDAAPTSVFFTDDHGNLTRSDPNQPSLPLREVSSPKAATA